MTRHLPQNKNLMIVVVAFLSLVSVLCGCKNKETSSPIAAAPVAAPAKQPQANAVQKVLSSSTAKLAPPPVGNQFDFSGKKDPFKPDLAVKTVTAPLPEDLRRALKDGLPIHSFDVSQFRLIGIITGAKENQAMVTDPSGKGYVLKTGMTIGKNDGRVTAVSMNGVDVVEQFKDDSGRVRKENIRITLPRKQ